MAVFLGLTMLTFNRTTAKKLENVAEDLETKLKLYDENNYSALQGDQRQQ
jgi:hypothetical protein